MSGLHPQYMLSKRFPVHAAIELQDLKTIALLLGNPKDARYHFDRKLNMLIYKIDKKRYFSYALRPLHIDLEQKSDNLS